MKFAATLLFSILTTAQAAAPQSALSRQSTAFKADGPSVIAPDVRKAINSLVFKTMGIQNECRGPDPGEICAWSMLSSTLIQRQIAGLPEAQVKQVTEWQAALNLVHSANFLITGEKFQVWLRERPDGSVDLEVKAGWVPPG